MTIRIASSLCCMLALGAAPSAAQDDDAWRQKFATYFMAAGMDGTVGLGPLDADVSLSFGDIFDHLELGVMMAYTASKGPWTIGIDALYVDLGARKSPTPDLAYEAEARQTLFGADAAYRATERFEVLGGFRYNGIDSGLAVSDPSGTRLASGSKSWVDPYIGGRLTLPILRRWDFVLRVDVGGGFDAGADSAWQLVSRFAWDATEQVDVIFGYRALYVDYEDGEGAGRFKYDVQSIGPLAGVAWSF